MSGNSDQVAFIQNESGKPDKVRVQKSGSAPLSHSYPLRAVPSLANIISSLVVRTKRYATLSDGALCDIASQSNASCVLLTAPASLHACFNICNQNWSHVR